MSGECVKHKVAADVKQEYAEMQATFICILHNEDAGLLFPPSFGGYKTASTQ